MAGKITAVATSVTAVGQALELGGRAAEGALRAIEFLAESGSPAAKRLQDSIAGVQQALTELADDPAIQSLGESLAGGLDVAAEKLLELPDLFRAAQDKIAEVITSGMESIGIAAEGSLDTLTEMQEQERQAVETARTRNAAERERLRLLKEQEKQAEENAKAAKAAAEEEDRFQQQLADDAARLEQEAFDKKNAHIAELVRNQEEANARLLQAERELHAERERLRREAIDKQKEGMQSSGAAGDVNRRAAEKSAVAKRLAQQAAEAKMTEIYQSGGDVDSATSRRDIANAQRAAHRAAIMQSRGGHKAFSDEQIQEAINANASAQIQSMQESGRFSNTALTALSESAHAQRQQGEEMRAMQNELAEVRRMLHENMQDSQRRRAQRNGSRQ